jgi:hypothetical protein
MAIQLTKEYGETGLTGNYWKLKAIHITLDDNEDIELVVGSYKLYASSSDFSSKKKSIESQIVRLEGGKLASTDLPNIITALEAEIIKAGEGLEGGTKV